MRILLSFICCNDDFLINEFKCAWGFDEGFWQIEWCYNLLVALSLRTMTFAAFKVE